MLENIFEPLKKQTSIHIGKPSMTTKGHPTNTANPMENMAVLTLFLNHDAYASITFIFY